MVKAGWRFKNARIKALGIKREGAGTISGNSEQKGDRIAALKSRVSGERNIGKAAAVRLQGESTKKHRSLFNYQRQQ